MIGPIRDLIRTKTARHTLTLFSGSVASKGIGFAILLALAHIMEREDYALFGMVMTVMWLVYEFTEMGINISLVRHAAEHVDAGKADRAAGLFRFAASVKVVLWIAVLLGGALASAPIAEAFLGSRNRAGAVLLALFGGVGLGAIILLNGVFYSHKQFYKDVVVALGQNGLKLVLVLTLALTAGLTLGGIIWIYALVPWAAVLLGLALVPRKALRWGALDRRDLASISRFGALFAGTVLMTSLANRIGIFLLRRLSSAETDVADFFLAQQLNMAILFLLAAYANVMFSKISSVAHWSEVLRVQRKSLVPLGVLAAGVVGLIALAGPLVPLILPAKYAATVPTIRWLLLADILHIFALPVGLALMYAKRIAPILAGHLLSFPLMMGLCFCWIPRWGAPGLAIAYTVSMALHYLVFGVYFLVRAKSIGRDFEPQGAGAAHSEGRTGG